MLHRAAHFTDFHILCNRVDLKIGPTDVPYALWFKWQKASVQLRPGGIDHGIRWNIQEGATAEKVLASPNLQKIRKFARAGL